METYDIGNVKQPLHTVKRNYMKMVMQMMLFIRAVKTAYRELHLVALEAFTKYFFAHDKLNYSKMIPVYSAEMKKLESSNLEIYDKFKQGNWIVNKNESLSFCFIGADNALENINRSIKVTGGLVGITLNPSA